MLVQKNKVFFNLYSNLKSTDFFFFVDNSSSWDTNGGGWFLHPQSNSDISGELTVSSSSNTDSYVGFNVDDEIMAAIRTELLNKLPQAQVNICI
jgi:hypothetical protein